MLKILIIVALVVILWNLGKALFHMSKNRGDPGKMARALTMRIGLSVLLFLFILLAFYMGWIEPHDITAKLPKE